MKLIDRIKDWRWGVQKLDQDFINGLGVGDGGVLEVSPSEEDFGSQKKVQKSFSTDLKKVERFLYVMQRYDSGFSFEIWKEKNFRFFFYASEDKHLDALRKQLKAVYPESEVRRPEFIVPELRPGLWISSATIELEGNPSSLRTFRAFNYDPLIHILDSMEGLDLVQVLFKPLSRETLKELSGRYGANFPEKMRESARYECLIRVISLTENPKATRLRCEHLSTSFSVFDSFRAQLVSSPVSFSIPWIHSSKRELKDFVKRRFPIFSKTLNLNLPELASIVHLPVGGEKHGVQYSRKKFKR